MALAQMGQSAPVGCIQAALGPQLLLQGVLPQLKDDTTCCTTMYFAQTYRHDFQVDLPMRAMQRAVQVPNPTSPLHSTG